MSIASRRGRTVVLWIAVTCHRFLRRSALADWQSRVQRFGKSVIRPDCDDDKSPAQSGEDSPYSKEMRTVTTAFIAILSHPGQCG